VSSQTPTVLLSQRFSSDSQSIWSAATKKGWPVHRAIRYAAPDPLPELRFAYGEVNFCDIMADRADLGLLDPPDDWLASLPYDLLKRNVVAITAKYVPGFDHKAFYKPANDKVFSAGVYECGRDVPLKYVDPDCPCYYSEVVSFDVEYRFWFLDGNLLTGDFYRMVGDWDESTVGLAAQLFAKHVMNNHSHKLPSAVVLDVGHIENEGWAVIEVNQCHASGIYGNTDVNGVMECCLRSAGPMNLVSDRDRKFLRNK